MRTKTLRNVVLGGLLALVAALAVETLGCATAPPPPPVKVEVRTAAPGPKAVWIPGHWKWHGRRRGYEWVPGHWKVK